jgi:hypothetical protein
MDGLNGGSERTDRMDDVNSVHSRREWTTSIPFIREQDMCRAWTTHVRRRVPTRRRGPHARTHTARRGATTRRMQRGATQDNEAASVALLRRLGGSPRGPQSHGRVGSCRGGGPTDAAASHADVECVTYCFVERHRQPLYLGRFRLTLASSRPDSDRVYRVATLSGLLQVVACGFPAAEKLGKKAPQTVMPWPATRPSP